MVFLLLHYFSSLLHGIAWGLQDKTCIKKYSLLTLKRFINVIKEHIRKPRKANWLSFLVLEIQLVSKAHENSRLSSFTLFLLPFYLKSLQTITLSGKVWVFFFHLALCYFYLAHFHSFSSLCAHSHPSMLLLFGSQQEGWLTFPSKFLRMWIPPLLVSADHAQLTGEAVQMPQKSRLCWGEPSGSLVPISS